MFLDGGLDTTGPVCRRVRYTELGAVTECRALQGTASSPCPSDMTACYPIAPPPPAALDPVSRTIVQEYVIAGSVDAFGPAQQESFKQSLATAAGIPASKITLTVSSASIRIIVTVQADSDADSSAMTASLNTITQSSPLGVTLLSVGAPSEQSTATSATSGAVVGSSTCFDTKPLKKCQKKLSKGKCPKKRMRKKCTLTCGHCVVA